MDHALRITIGNLIAMAAIAVFASRDLLPIWLIFIPMGIHVAIGFVAWKNHQKNELDKD